MPNRQTDKQLTGYWNGLETKLIFEIKLNKCRQLETFDGNIAKIRNMRE